MGFRKIKDFAIELLSFGSPRAIVINLVLILVIVAIVPIGQLHFFPSVFKGIILPLVFGGQCPESGILKDCNIYSTGETRALSKLLDGDIEGAIAYNWLIVFLFPVIVFLIVFNLTKIIRNRKK